MRFIGMLGLAVFLLMPNPCGAEEAVWRSAQPQWKSSKTGPWINSTKCPAETSPWNRCNGPEKIGLPLSEVKNAAYEKIQVAPRLIAEKPSATIWLPVKPLR